MILNLMERFVRSEFQQLKEDDNLNIFLNDVKLRSSQPNTFIQQTTISKNVELGG